MSVNEELSRYEIMNSFFLFGVLAETLQPLHPRPFPFTNQKPGPSASPPRPQPGVGPAPQRPH